MWARDYRTHREGQMGSPGWSTWIRQFHRWVSIIFTITVAANFAVMAMGEPPMWLVYSPLAPLFLLLFSGLCVFVLPYVRRGSRA